VIIGKSFGKREQGFSLLFIVLIFVVIAAASVGAVFFAAKIKTISAERRTIANMQVVREAMKKYYRGHYDLPDPSGAGGNEVPTAALNLKPSYGQDAWGQPLYYFRLTDDTTGTTRTNIRGVRVEGGPLAAGVLISRGTDQTFNYTLTAGNPTQFTTTTDDVALPVDVQAEAYEIATETLHSLAKKLCSYVCQGYPVSDTGYSPVVENMITVFALGAVAYGYDPWLERYEWIPGLPGQFRSLGPDKTADNADDLYVKAIRDQPCCQPSSPEPHELLEEFMVFGGLGLTFGQGANTNAPIGSNTSVNADHTSTYGDIQSGGTVTIDHGTTVGHILACGDVTVDGTATGEVHSGGNVLVDNQGTVEGNIYADGDVTVEGEAQGDVHSGGNVVVDQAPGAGHVAGSVYAAGTITLLGAATIDGNQYPNNGPPAPTAPIACVPTVKFPCLATITPGGANVTVNADQSLAPGTYQDLTINNNRTLTLSCGTYTFNQITVNNNGKINLNLSGGAGCLLNIFVLGNVTTNQNFLVRVSTDGVNYYAVSNPLSANIDPDDAARVYLELHGAWSMTQGGVWFGTIYSLGAINILQNFFGVGAIYSQDTVTVPQNFTLTYVQSTHALSTWVYPPDPCP